MEVNGCRDNSEMISEANQPKDTWVSSSVEVNYKEFRRRLEGDQLLLEWDSISYLPIESFDDYWNYSIDHMQQSRVTGNANAGIYRNFLESCLPSAIRCEQSRQFRPQLHTQVHLWLYSWAERSREVHSRTIRADLCNTHNSHLAAPPIAMPIAITSTLNRIIYVIDDVRNLLQGLQKPSAMIELWIPISFIDGEAMFKKMQQWSQMVLQLWMGSILLPPPNVLKWLAVTNRKYYGQLAPDWTTKSQCCKERVPSAPTKLYFVKQVNKSWSIANKLIMICP